MSITVDQIRDLVPKSQRDSITDEFIQKLNEFNKDPRLVGSFKDNVLGYIGVMKEGKYSLEEYINAVRWVSYKLLGSTDIDTYNKVFPDRYERLKQEGVSRDQMSAYTSAYKKSKLVIQIMEQTLVPNYVLNAPMYQDALNVQAELMMNARSEMVRQKAADSLLTHLAVPQEAKIKLDIGMSDETKNAQKQLVDHVAALAINQQKMLTAGLPLDQLQRLNIPSKTEDIIDAEDE